MGWRFEVQTMGDGDHWSKNGQVFATPEDAEASGRDLMSRWTLVMAYRVVEVKEPANQEGPTLKGAGHRVRL